METASSLSIISSSVISLDSNPPQRKEKFTENIFSSLFAAFAASMMALSMGTVEAYTSMALPSMEDSSKIGPVSKDDQRKITSIALLAALLSGPQLGYLVGKIGRKTVLAISALPFVIGWLLIAASSYIPMIYLGRFVTGFCAGTASLVVPIYIAEISTDKNRGMLCSMFQLSVTVGNFFVYIVGSFLDWQWLAFVCGMIPLAALLLIAPIPATPTFLLSKDRVLDAVHSLMWLRGAKSEDVQQEILAIQHNLAACNEEKKSCRNFFRLRTIRPMGICLFLFLFQQLTGIEVILVYTVHIFEAAGGNMDPELCTIIVGFVQIVATLFSALIVDKAGRRLLLIVSEMGVAAAMMAMLLHFHFQKNHQEYGNNFGWVPLTSLCIFIAFFSIGVGPVPFLMLGELNSPAVIGIASSLATTCYWGFAYLSTVFFVEIEEDVGLEWCFGAFSVCSLLASVFVYIFVPETKGRSMEDIQNYFRKGKFKIRSF